MDHYYLLDSNNGPIITVILDPLLTIITRSIMGNSGFHYYPLLTSPTCRWGAGWAAFSALSAGPPAAPGRAYTAPTPDASAGARGAMRSSIIWCAGVRHSRYRWLAAATSPPTLRTGAWRGARLSPATSAVPYRRLERRSLRISKHPSILRGSRRDSCRHTPLGGL